MKLTDYSKTKLRLGANNWYVEDYLFDSVYNYLVYGFGPGSFFTSVLANNFVDAMTHSHPANRVSDLKNLVGWMVSHFPTDSFGSYEKVDAWLQLTDDERREKLEDAKMIYTLKEEMILSLKDAPLIRG
jgi:hypothetical protein